MDISGQIVLTWQAWFTLILIMTMVVFLVKEWLSPDVALPSVLAILLGVGILEPALALEGFSNHGLLAIAALFVVARGMQDSGGLGNSAAKMLENGSGLMVTYIRMIVPITAVSAFLNNTPVVAMFVSPVRSFAIKNNIAPSKLLIPLSFASILGGLCTLVGTATNLVVSGMMKDAGYEPIGMFEITKIGLPAAIAGIIFLVLFSKKLLPSRVDLVDKLEGDKREFLIDMLVEDNCPLIGQTIEKGGLRHLKGLYLTHIERGGVRQGPASPNLIIRSGDRLQFTGLVSTIVDLNNIKGLIPAEDSELVGAPSKGESRLFEVVVATASPLVGLGIRQAGFRNSYEAVVIAVYRAGHRIKSKVGDIVMKPGDTLLIEAPSHFARRWYNSTHFFLVSQVGDVSRIKHEKNKLVLFVVAAMILVPAFSIAPMVVSAFAAASILVLTRVVSPSAAKKSINLSILIVIASALGIGKAIEQTGLAAYAATNLIDLISFMGPLAILAVIMIVTNFFTELVTNMASAAMFFPVALATAEQLKYESGDPQMRAFQIAIALAAAASFATPLGYQTNLIVYGPGGYKYTDFLKIGVPMNILVISTGIAASWYWFF